MLIYKNFLCIFLIGAGSGIGRAACQVLAQQGASIIAADKNVKGAKEIIEEIKQASKNQHLSIELDVDKSSSIKNALEQTIKTFKNPPSIIVNCAGITRDNFLLKLSEEDFDSVINVNLKGTFMMTQTFAKALVDRQIAGGSIINIASIVGKYGNIGQSNYCASKAGVELLTKVAAKEFGKFGIRCNVILPGFIRSPMTDAIPDKVKDKFVGMIPAGRFGDPKEIAEVIAFLASEKSSYVNGASIDVTGGF